ncbi:hypothetical protein P7K49_033131 [Saguinus oedipus]|uniref:Uncharacterized protein n=1 Tax=Saguinus oedipus TaxID=9490 RepID=A0ABQ9TR18_SAGOE|nr:hypothetical protein P7K49_033131 [Saguinus oedipus]
MKDALKGDTEKRCVGKGSECGPAGNSQRRCRSSGWWWEVQEAEIPQQRNA